MPQFSDAPTPIRTDDKGVAVLPEWSEEDVKKPTNGTTPTTTPTTTPRKRVAKALQPDATQMDSVTQAQEWLRAHPEEAEMLRQAQDSATGDILADSGVDTRWYSSTECAAFFDKSVQWLYWGMRHPPHGGRLFIQEKMIPVIDSATGLPLRDASNEIVYEVATDENGDVIWEDIPVPRIGDPVRGKRRFNIATIRKFAKSAYHQANIKEPKLRAVLERLVVAELGGNWKSVPIPVRKEEELVHGQ